MFLKSENDFYTRIQYIPWKIVFILFYCSMPHKNNWNWKHKKVFNSNWERCNKMRILSNSNSDPQILTKKLYRDINHYLFYISQY
jgi:hypothetical protein